MGSGKTQGAYFPRLVFLSDPCHLASLGLLPLRLILHALSTVVPACLSLLQTALMPQVGQQATSPRENRGRRSHAQQPTPQQRPGKGPT